MLELLWDTLVAHIDSGRQESRCKIDNDNTEHFSFALYEHIRVRGGSFADGMNFCCSSANKTKMIYYAIISDDKCRLDSLLTLKISQCWWNSWWNSHPNLVKSEISYEFFCEGGKSQPQQSHHKECQLCDVNVHKFWEQGKSIDARLRDFHVCENLKFEEALWGKSEKLRQISNFIATRASLLILLRLLMSF